MVDETLSTVQELTRERAQIQKKHGTKRPRSSEEAAFKVQRVNIDRREPLSSIRNHGVERGGGRTVTEAKDQRRTRGVGAPSRGHGDAGVDQDARPSANAREERIRVLPGHPVVTTGFNERQNPPLPRNTWPSQATPPGLAMPPPPVAFASQPHVQLTPPADDPPPRSCRGPAPTAAAGPSQPLMPPPRPVQTVGKKKALGMRPNRKGGSPTCSQPFKTPLLAKTAACAGGQTAAPVPPKLPTTRVSTAKSAAPITPEDTPPRVKPCEGGGGDEDEEMKDADSSINYSFDELDQETLLACSIYD
ncbi:hypothetical protein FOMPIDRAFT_95971 [Fomitopsis schrenkii]|uniref:Uncharacterized protein n=1 Tax=Fomitopsis schrenkii TaxID=2126942 RepID=S8F635_FOMSC|nr:hypothetical protein FOMPIDRAFT_95971 [Fomitopsis schrenkii]